MTKCRLPSATSLQRQSFTLKPTTTVVRNLPIVAEGWETAALGGDTFSSHEMEDEEANRVAITAFQQALVSQKSQLEPTLTVVRHCLTVVASKPSEPKPKPKPTPSLEHLHMRPKHWTEAHGFRGDSSWELPRQMVHCEQEARPVRLRPQSMTIIQPPTLPSSLTDVMIYSGLWIKTRS